MVCLGMKDVLFGHKVNVTIPVLPGSIRTLFLSINGIEICCMCHATRMEEDPEVTLDIHCLRRGGRVALTLTNNYFLHRRGSGGAWVIMV